MARNHILLEAYLRGRASVAVIDADAAEVLADLIPYCDMMSLVMAYVQGRSDARAGSPSSWQPAHR